MSDTAAVNQAYFNKLAAGYDDSFQKAMAIIEKELRDSVNFIGFRKGGRLLDYACGTGLLSRALGDHLSQCVGIDISESMVEAYNANARSQGFPPEQRRALVGNLLGDDAGFADASLAGFDVAGVGAGFHHFDDCALAAQRLAARLRPGGVLLIVDFVVHAADPDHAAAAGVRHHGFTEDQVRAFFEAAGAARGFAFRPMDDDIVFERPREQGGDMVRRLFVARGEKV